MQEFWHISLLFDCQVPERNSLQIPIAFSLPAIVTILPADSTTFKGF